MAESFNTTNNEVDDALSFELDPADDAGSTEVRTQQPNSAVRSSEDCPCDENITSTNSETSDENFRSRAETTDRSTVRDLQLDDDSHRGSHPVEILDDCKPPGEHPDVLTRTGRPEQNSNSQLASDSSRSMLAGASNAEALEASAMPEQNSYRDEQYSQASICSCFCTCEPYEEMNAMYETEESMPVCVQCEELSESECTGPDDVCSCDENLVIVRPLYAVHCCTCGVQLAHGCEPSEVPGEGSDEASGDGAPTLDDRAEGVPIPPPPPSQSSYLFLGSRLSRLPVLRHGPSSSSDPHDSTAATPTLLLRALSCDDGSEFDSRLHEAARAGLADKLAALLKEDNLRACINSRARPLMATPLREAVVGASTECVRLLLAAGAAVDAIDIKGQTALFMAASLGRPEIVETLLRAGADPEGSRCNNCTPLLLTIREGCVRGLKSLLRHGVDPEPLSVLRTCTPGWPLQYCVVFRRLDCFLELLRGGAEPSLALVLARGGQNMTDVDEPVLRRLSIVRSVLQHASDMPEFIRIYREFGGPCGQVAELPDDLRLSTSAARQELQAVLDTPLRLTSQCRVRLLRAVGAPRLPALAAEFGLPSHLRAFLAFTDLDSCVALANDEQSLREP